MPEYVQELIEAEAKKAEMEARLKAATGGNADDEESPDTDDGSGEESLTEEEIKALRKELGAARKDLKALRQDLLKRIEKARAGLSAADCQHLVLDIAKRDLMDHLELYVTSHRTHLTNVVENWWDKYKTTLHNIEAERHETEGCLRGFMTRLGYGS